jgi:hypothetical protein
VSAGSTTGEGVVNVPECVLRASVGRRGTECDGAECVYWRAVGQLGVAVEPQPEQCAIQHFRLLDGGAEVAAWLASVKERMESGSSSVDES